LNPITVGRRWVIRHLIWVRLPTRSCGYSTVVVRLPVKPGAP
jgi:hypothetical protein